VKDTSTALKGETMADTKTLKVGFEWDAPDQRAQIIETWRLDGWEVQDQEDNETGFTITLRRIET
jgi:hypothetical protein